MRLLLDEHYSRAIAEHLRARGHDVVAAGERSDLRSAGDDALFATARAERRALVTNNVADFMPLVHAAVQADELHYGVIFTSDRALPRSRATIGRFVELLDDLLRAVPGDDALADQVRWLP